MRILISGADGVVGREIANQLSKNKKYKLFLLSNKKKNKKKNKLFYQDLTKPINLKIKPYAIIHCAAKHHFSKTGNDMRNIYSTNIKMTQNLIKFSNKNNVKKFIFFSSVDIYGVINKNIVFENQKPNKPNLYGRSKFLSEKLFCHEKNKFKAVCLRIPGMFTFNLKKNHPLVIKILKSIMNDENVHTYNLNKKFNNIVDVREVIKLIMIVLKKKRINSEIYNFSASYPIKFVYVINLIKKIFRSKSKIIKIKQKKSSFVISNKKISEEFNLKISSTKKIITRCCKRILNKDYIVA